MLGDPALVVAGPIRNALNRDLPNEGSFSKIRGSWRNGSRGYVGGTEDPYILSFCASEKEDYSYCAASEAL